MTKSAYEPGIYLDYQEFGDDHRVDDLHDLGGNGSALYVGYGSVQITGSTFEEDGAEFGDGAMSSYAGSLSLTTTRLVRDVAGQRDR